VPPSTWRAITRGVLLQLLRRRIRTPRLLLLMGALILRRFRKLRLQRFLVEMLDLAVLPLWIYIRPKARVG
jgi:hypothetical protein